MSSLRDKFGLGARHGDAPWHGTAFLVEACVLLTFVVAAVAVFAALFFGAAREGARAEQLTQAVTVARDAAERFAAEGAAADGSWESNGMTVQVDVSEDDEIPGLLRAEVVVLDGQGAELYRLETARATGGDAS